MDISRKLCIALVFGVIASSSIRADVPGLALNNARKMGMGNAGVAVSYDDSALYINPAGLSRVQGPTIKFPRIQAHVGTEIYQNLDKINTLKGATDDDADILDQLIGMDGSLGMGASPLLSFVTQGFGVGVFAATDFNLRINQDSSLSAFGNTDAIAALGTARQLSIFGQKIDMGISIKGVRRMVIYDKLTGNTSIELESGDVIDRINDETIGDAFSTFEVAGLGVDLGLLTDITLLGSPATFGMSVRNIGSSLSGSREVASVNESAQVNLPIETTIGIAMTPKLPLIGDILMAADYTVSPSDSIYTSLHLGVEKKLFFDTVNLRCGVNQGYLVGGIGIDLRIFHFDYVYFAKELGHTAGDKPDLMHAIEIGFLL